MSACQLAELTDGDEACDAELDDESSGSPVTVNIDVRDPATDELLEHRELRLCQQHGKELALEAMRARS